MGQYQLSLHTQCPTSQLQIIDYNTYCNRQDKIMTETDSCKKIHCTRGVAAIHKVRGQICPCAVGNRSSVRAIALIACVIMRALVYEVGGLCPQYNKSGGPLPPLLLPLCVQQLTHGKNPPHSTPGRKNA